MRVLIGIQARSNSSRFPCKIYKELDGDPLLIRVWESCDVDPYPAIMKVRRAVLGMSSDSELSSFCASRGIQYIGYSGEENDLSARYWDARGIYDAVVRVTGDCPLIQPVMIEEVLTWIAKGYGYVTNTSPRTFVDGLDVQAITTEAFEKYRKLVPEEEHLFYQLENNCNVYQELYDEGVVCKSIINPNKVIPNPFHEENKYSVDEQEDLERVRDVLRSKSGHKVSAK